MTDDVFALVAEGRVEAEALMVDTVDVYAKSSGGTFDESTGKLTGGTGALIYSGKAKRVMAKRFEQQANSGGREYVETRDELHLPMSAPRVGTGAVATVTAAPMDPNAVGVKLYVNGPSSGSLSTAQRLHVTEVVG